MIFYTPDIEDAKYILNEEESGHAVRVLRLKAGSEIELVDGRGGWYRAVVVAVHHKRCEVEVAETIREYGKRPYRLHVAIAPTKNIDRFEWFVEKSVEIGIDEITPLLCEHSERNRIQPDRIRRIMVAAMKQSKKAYLPKLNELTAFGDWIKPADGSGFIAYCGEGNKQSLKASYQAGCDAVIAIGPEGDFSRREVDKAAACGFVGTDLGPSRLRTETAGVAVCHAIYFMNT